MFKHKYKIGESVFVNGVAGRIHSLGHAVPKSPKFIICNDKKEIDDESLIGYQVEFVGKIKIIKETDITLA
jgi:hypothetical protein